MKLENVELSIKGSDLGLLSKLKSYLDALNLTFSSNEKGCIGISVKPDKIFYYGEEDKRDQADQGNTIVMDLGDKVMVRGIGGLSSSDGYQIIYSNEGLSITRIISGPLSERPGFMAKEGALRYILR